MKKQLPKVFILAVTGLLTSASGSNADLISYWNFDDGATASDLVGTNNGELKNGAGFSTDVPSFVSGRANTNSLDLSNGQDYVLLPRNDFGIGATDSFTISTWVKYTSSERGAITVMQDLTSTGRDRSGITFGIDRDNKVFIGIVGSSGGNDAANSTDTFRDITTDQTVPTGQWVHLAATFEEDMIIAYLNGAAAVSYSVFPDDTSTNPDGSNVTGGTGIDFVDANGSFTGFGASGNAPTAAGSPGDFTRFFYEGLLDDIAIWDEGLSANSIQRLAGGESPVQVPEPSSVVLLFFAGVIIGVLRRRRV